MTYHSTLHCQKCLQGTVDLVPHNGTLDAGKVGSNLVHAPWCNQKMPGEATGGSYKT